MVLHSIPFRLQHVVVFYLFVNASRASYSGFDAVGARSCLLFACSPGCFPSYFCKSLHYLALLTRTCISADIVVAGPVPRIIATGRTSSPSHQRTAPVNLFSLLSSRRKHKQQLVHGPIRNRSCYSTGQTFQVNVVSVPPQQASNSGVGEGILDEPLNSMLSHLHLPHSSRTYIAHGLRTISSQPFALLSLLLHIPRSGYYIRPFVPLSEIDRSLNTFASTNLPPCQPPSQELPAEIISPRGSVTLNLRDYRATTTGKSVTILNRPSGMREQERLIQTVYTEQYLPHLSLSLSLSFTVFICLFDDPEVGPARLQETWGEAGRSCYTRKFQ